MTETQTLLAQYAQNGSESAFRELVTRYLDLVYSTALRLMAGDSHRAQDVAQTVFVDLARKARSLPRGVMLGGWLHQHTRFVSANVLRSERRRQSRERQAADMNAQDDHSEANLAQIAPVLDEVISELEPPDRTAILLRYFEQKDLRAVGEALGSSEDAARKRVSRALDELQSLLKRRGIALSAAVLGSLLSVQAVTAAPVGLAGAIASAAFAGGAGSGLSAFGISKTKLLGASAIVIVATIGTLLVQTSSRHAKNELAERNRLDSEAGEAAPQAGTATALAEEPTPVIRDPFPASVRFTLGVAPGAAAVQPDGKIVIGTTLSGFFVDGKSGILGTYHRGALRIRADGTLDRGFYCQVTDSGASDAMRARLDLHSDGRILMSGFFNSVEDQPRPGYAMLLPDGRVDSTFEPWRGMTNQLRMRFTHGSTFPAALLADGSVAVGNSAIERKEVSYLQSAYRLDSSGLLISSLRTNISAPEFSSPSGLILTLGPVGFWTRKPINWSLDSRAGIRPAFLSGLPSCDYPFERWKEPPSAGDAAAVLQALFDEIPLELCRYAVKLPDGGAVIAIRDEVVNGARNVAGRFMRFDKDWRPDFSFTNHYVADLGSCMTLKSQKDGKLLLAGLVGKFYGEDFPGLTRLNKDGSVDRSFRCETSERTTGDPVTDALRRRVIGLAIQEDGRIVITGFFTRVNGVDCHHIARLNPDGSLDETFNTPFSTWEELKAWRRFPVHRLSPATVASARTSVATSNEAPVAPAASPAQTILIASLEIQDGVAVIRYSGRPRQQYILQARNAFNSGDWTSVSTNSAGADGAGIFRDSESRKYSMRFYRVASP